MGQNVPPPQKIGIIGAGVAGLAAAVRMAARGHQVEVFEANAYPGGKLSEFEMQGYRFDAGPSLFTMPQYVEELFAVAGVDAKTHFTYERLPIICNYFWEDQTRISAFADEQAFAAEVEAKLGVPAAKLQLFFADSARKYRLTGRIFLEQSLHRLRTWLTSAVAKALFQIASFDLFSTMNAVNERMVAHPKLVQLLNRFATYNGSNPYRAPGLLTIIPHFEHHIGAFYPKGGMYSISRSIFELAQSQGVQFHFNTPVEEILVKNGRAWGLKVNGETRAYDQVISNMDVFYTYRKLLPREKHPERTLAQEKSTSALIFYWGIQKIFPELAMHNIFFSEDYRTEFTQLNQGKVFDDPTVYVNLTTSFSPEDAPEGCQNWFVMVNVPFNAGQDWEEIISRTRQNVMKKLSRILDTDISDLIACEDLLDPRSIESKTQSHLGALYGTSSNDRMAAFLRHPNFSRRIKNLYFCGGSVHPGGGIPLALLSAKIVDEEMHRR
jgi:phytoene desaturase